MRVLREASHYQGLKRINFLIQNRLGMTPVSSQFQLLKTLSGAGIFLAEKPHKTTAGKERHLNFPLPIFP
jgi:hypothetical protein